LRTSDYWAANIEEWTYATNSDLLEGHAESYVRIESIDPDDLETERDPNTGIVQIRNRPAGETGFPFTILWMAAFSNSLATAYAPPTIITYSNHSKSMMQY
jgi:hypothetical protein